MKKKYFIMILLILLGFAVIGKIYEKETNAYEDWPGQNGNIKANLQFTVGPFDGYGLKFDYFSPNLNFDYFSPNNNMLGFNLPLARGDTTGDFRVEILSTIDEAQLRMHEFWTLINAIIPAI